MKKIFFCSLQIGCFLLISSKLFSQKESNIWYFGTNAGIDFNSGSPVSITGGALVANEGCASICDSAGNLLFYTDGNIVWNKNHAVIGSGLAGSGNGTQSPLIVRRPSCYQYYLFTAPSLGDQGTSNPPAELKYSIVDLEANAVVKQDSVLSPGVAITEKMVAVLDNTGDNVWVVVHKWESDSFYCYLVTENGINSPVISRSGPIYQTTVIAGNSYTYNGIGQLKASPDGSKLSAVHYDTKGVTLFDFDNSTGIVSNAIDLNGNFFRPYATEFSADGTKLYCSYQATGPNRGAVGQFDISSGVQATILATKTTVGTATTVSAPGGLQMAPDGKIYCSISNSSSLDVIGNPNGAGASCNYVNGGFNLGSTQCKVGLPPKNIVQNITLQYPVASAGSDVSIGNGASITLNGSGGGTYFWTPSSSLSCNSCASPTAAPPGTTMYTLIVTNSMGCHDTDDVVVTVEDCKTMFIPNAFSPNNDGQNDEYKVIGNCLQSFSLEIFNRWGMKVFETTDVTKSWNGYVDGELANTGAYHYKMIAETNSAKTVKTGIINLIR